MSEENAVEAVQTEMDYDWDTMPEDFPSATQEQGEDTDEASVEKSMEQSEDKSSENVREKSSEESREAPREASDSKEEDSSREEEGDKEDSKGPIDINALEDDTLVKVKVDGEIQEISIKEFKNGISGEKAIAKRFSEYDRKEKEFKTEINEINSYVNNFAAKMQSKDPVAALEYLAQFTDVPAYEVKDMLIEKLLPEIERRSQLMPEQLQLEKDREKLKFEKERTESEQKKFESQRTTKELEDKISNIQNQFQISQEDWDAAFEYLDKSLPADQAITLDTVKERALFSRAESILDSVDSKLLETPQIISNMVDLQNQNPDFSREDLVEIVKDAFGYGKKVLAEDNLQEAKKSKVESKKDSLQKQSTQILEPEVDDWEDFLD